MSKTADEITRQSTSRNIYVFIVSLLVVLICGASIFAIFITENIASKHAPLIDLTTEIKLEVTLTSLYLEYLLTNDGYRNKNEIYEKLAIAEHYSELILFGGEGPEGRVLPVEDSKLKEQVTSIKWHIEALKILSGNLIESKINGIKDKQAENEFHREYGELFDELEKIEHEFNRLMQNDRRLIFWVESGVVLLVLLLGVSVWLIFQKYDENSVKQLRSLKEARKLADWAHDKLNITLDSIGDAVIATDLKGVITRINPNAQKLTGWTEDDAVGRQIQDVLEIFDQNDNRLKNPLLEVLATGKSVALSNSALLRSRDGSIYPIADSATIIKSRDDEIYGAVMVFRDVTEKYAREQMLIESEEKFSLLFIQSNDAIFLHDLDGKIIDVNDKALSTFQYSKDEMLEFNVTHLHPESEKKISQNAFKQIMRNGSVFFEVEFKKKDGTTFPAEVSSRKFTIGSREVIQDIVRDITERKRSQQEIVQLATVVDQANQIIIVTDLKGNIEYANPFFEKVTGYKLAEVLGKNANILKSGRQDKMFYKNLWDTILSGETWNGTFINKKKDGTEYHEEAQIFPIKDESGEIVKFAAVKKDITLQVQAQENQKESEDKYKNIFFNSPIGIIHYSSNGRITECNNKFCEIFDVSPADVVRTNLLEDYTDIHLENAARDSLKKGIGFYEGYYKNSALQDSLYLKVIFQGITDRRNKITGGIALVEDLTDKKKADEAIEAHRAHLEEMVEQRTIELASANEQLADEIDKQKKIEEQVIQSLDKEKELNELKSNFISTVSHEFRTPLTTILTSADLIELYSKDWTKERLNTHTHKIQNAVQSMKGMLEEMLNIGKSDSAARDFTPQKFDLRELCQKIVEEHKLNADKEKEISLNYISRKHVVKLDERLFSEILNNLISNSVKYTNADGKIEINVQIKDNEIEFSVKDDGIGIPAEEQNTIFEPFSRGSDVSGIEGSGLGLTIVKNAVELHNGKIECTSMKDTGTIFTVRLPLSID